MNIQQFWPDVPRSMLRGGSLYDKIVAMDEYWADDGEAPKWAQALIHNLYLSFREKGKV